ncbi:hypothetical protein BDR06DRAFT_878371, partial [Suillus hirtellus]
EVMQHIADIIWTADMPSSLRSVPYNFGETKAGTVKADEWCMLMTVYLPIALLQWLPSNHIFGTISIFLSMIDFSQWLTSQQKSTLLHSYIQAAKLKCWLN